MNISSSQVESIVRKILGEIAPSNSAKSGKVPTTAKVAMLTGPKKIEVKEFNIPTVGDNDILVKVEGCGVCGTDVHEWKGDPFGLIPHSDANPLTGWFATHLLISGKGSTYFVVNDLDLKERMLLELACVCVHALKRANTTGLINFNSKVLVQGLGPVGLVMISVLRAAGVNHIVAIDGTPMRLEMAKKLGAKTVISFKEMTSLEDRVNLVKKECNGVGVDFAFQCTGAPMAAKDIYEYIRRGGGMCEMGFFVNNGEYTVNPHFAMCNKEINIVGSWDYSADDYPTTMAFLRQAREMNIPIKDLITHTFPLDRLNEAMEVNVSQQGIKICYVKE